MGLKWLLQKTVVNDLVAYAVAKNNICRTMETYRMSASSAAHGIKVKYKTEFELAIGDLWMFLMGFQSLHITCALIPPLHGKF